MAIKMNRKLVEKWVRYLRSGRYKQTQGMLVDSKGNYCCLGVAVCAKTGRRQKKYSDAMEAAYGDGCQLDMSLLEELGLDYKKQATLIQLNDDKSFTFNQIADYIEKTLLKKKGKKK